MHLLIKKSITALVPLQQHFLIAFFSACHQPTLCIRSGLDFLSCFWPVQKPLKLLLSAKRKKTGLACCLTQQPIWAFWTEHLSHTNTLLSTTREKWPFHLLSCCTRFKSLAKSWYEAQRYGVERSAHVNVIMTFFSVKKKPSLVKCHLSVPKSFTIVASSSLSCTFNPDKLPPQYTNTLNSNLKSVRPRVSR